MKSNWTCAPWQRRGSSARSPAPRRKSAKADSSKTVRLHYKVADRQKVQHQPFATVTAWIFASLMSCSGFHAYCAHLSRGWKNLPRRRWPSQRAPRARPCLYIYPLASPRHPILKGPFPLTMPSSSCFCQAAESPCVLQAGTGTPPSSDYRVRSYRNSFYPVHQVPLQDKMKWDVGKNTIMQRSGLYRQDGLVCRRGPL